MKVLVVQQIALLLPKPVSHGQTLAAVLLAMVTHGEKPTT